MLLHTLPDSLLEQEEQHLFRYGLPGIYFTLLLRHPQKLHEYIGVLGKATLPVDPVYIQVAFWTILVLFMLYVVGIFYNLSRRFFS